MKMLPSSKLLVFFTTIMLLFHIHVSVNDFAIPSPEITESKAQTPLHLERTNGDVFFNADDHEITDKAEPVLKNYAETLKQNPDMKLTVEGYTDLKGTEEYNRELGKSRAESVKEYLVNQGIDPLRIETSGKGRTEQFAPGDTEDDFSLNRRAHITIREGTSDEKKVDEKTSESGFETEIETQLESSPTIEKPSFRLSESVQKEPPTVKIISDSEFASKTVAQASPTPNKLSKILEVELKKAAPQRISFDIPDEMKLGESTNVEASFSRLLFKDMFGGLRTNDLDQEVDIKLDPSVKVELFGHNFSIVPKNHTQQTLSFNQSTFWSWKVTPLKRGTQSLVLLVGLKTETDSGVESKASYPVFEKAVEVNSNPIHTASKFIKDRWKWVIILIAGASAVIWILGRDR